jgi:hypothetical protein
LRGMLWELGIPVGDIPLHCDNSGSLRHLKDPVNTIHTKHIAIKFARAREAVMRGEVKPGYDWYRCQRCRHLYEGIGSHSVS